MADLPRETFAVPVTALASQGGELGGDHVAVLRAFDVAGNPGTARVEFKAP